MQASENQKCPCSLKEWKLFINQCRSSKLLYTIKTHSHGHSAVQIYHLYYLENTTKSKYNMLEFSVLSLNTTKQICDVKRRCMSHRNACTISYQNILVVILLEPQTTKCSCQRGNLTVLGPTDIVWQENQLTQEGQLQHLS